MDTSPRTTADPLLEQAFRLESLEIDPATGLVFGPGGRESLDRKVMDVFIMMVRNRGRVVSRDELLARLWANTVVTDDAVTRCICVLRKQLCRAGGNHRYRELIETLPKRGYRFKGVIAPLRLDPAPVARRHGARRFWGFAIATTAAFALLAIIAAGAG